MYRLQCLYNLGNYATVVGEAPSLLKGLEGEEVDTLRFCLAESRFHLGQKEHRDELLQEALVDYRALLDTKYADQTFLPQALILGALKRYGEAASLYLTLAEKDGGKREEYLFYAASLQVHEDKKRAIETFGKICALEGRTAAKAAFNCLSLLFQEKDYRGFILAYDRLIPQIAEEKVPLIQYYLGKSLFQIQDYNRALSPLSQALHSEGLTREQEKGALLSLIACADKLDNALLVEKTAERLVKEFENSVEASQALLLQLGRARDRQEWGKAQQAVSLLLQISSDTSKRDALLYDQGLLFIQEKKWDEAGNLFEKLVAEGSEEVLKAKALRQWVHSRLEEAREASFVSERVKQELLREALEAALAKSSLFSTREKRQLRFLAGKTAYALERYQEAIGILTEYCRDFGNDSSCAEGHLLLAESHRKGLQDGAQFAFHAEKALALHVALQEPHLLHLALYNTYLDLAKSACEEEKVEKVARAADHLYSALSDAKSVQNKRWLADHYLQEVKKGRKEYRGRAATVLKHLIGALPLQIDGASLEKEGEAIRLAQLYKELGAREERIALLESLKACQETAPDLMWRYQRMAAFELAVSLGETGKTDPAIEILETLITDSCRSYYSNAAKLTKAKLRFVSLHEEEKREDSPTILQICDQLKEVELQRRLHSEPLHLEAALLYIDIKTELCPKAERPSKKISLLKQLQERFQEREDCLVQEYFSTERQFPDKMRLFEQYMRFVSLRVRGYLERI